MDDFNDKIPEVARPVTLETLDPDQQAAFLQMLVAYDALVSSGVDRFRLFASMPTF